jgi:hypothetical protein
MNTTFDRHRNTWLWFIGLGLLIVVRFALQFSVYAAGFESLTADDFGRVIVAATWADRPAWVSHGTALPFHTYVIGSALLLYNDLFLTPRVVVFIAGACSLVLMFLLTQALFQRPLISAIATLLLAVNPAHVWLSSTPLTEILHLTAVLAFLYLLVRAWNGSFRQQLITALVIAVATSIRFESWIFAALISMVWISVASYRAWQQRSLARLGQIFALLLIIWLFPVVWVLGNYLVTGDPLFFVTSNRSFDTYWYGNRQDYAPYFSTLLRLDPTSTLLTGLACSLCLYIYRRTPHIGMYIGLIVGTFLIFAVLQRGQVQPDGNYVRYLALFSILPYPIMAWLLVFCAEKVSPQRRFQHGLLAFIVVGLCLWQINSSFRFVNDPAAEGLQAGLQLRTLRAQQPTLPNQPVLIELNHYQYVAMHVGANDRAQFVYDRPIDYALLNATPTLLGSDTAQLHACIVRHQLHYIVVRDPALQQLVQSTLAASPSHTMNTYQIYIVPATLREPPMPTKALCPLPPK